MIVYDFGPIHGGVALAREATRLLVDLVKAGHIDFESYAEDNPQEAGQLYKWCRCACPEIFGKYVENPNCPVRAVT